MSETIEVTHEAIDEFDHEALLKFAHSLFDYLEETKPGIPELADSDIHEIKSEIESHVLDIMKELGSVVTIIEQIKADGSTDIGVEDMCEQALTLLGKIE